MIVLNKRIKFAFFIAVVVTIVVFAYIFFSIRISCKEQVAEQNKQSIEALLARLQNYQEGVENSVLTHLFEGGDELLQPNLSSSIRVLSFSDSTGGIISSNFISGNYYLVKAGVTGLPFSAIIYNSDELWAKSSICISSGVVEYAYRLDQFLGYLNQGNVKFIVRLKDSTNSNRTFGLFHNDFATDINPEENSFEVSDKGRVLSILANAQLLSTDNLVVGGCYTIDDITSIKAGFGRVLVSSIFLGFFAFGLVLLAMFLLWRNSADRRKAALAIAQLRGDGIAASFTNHEIKQIYNATANGIRIINTNFDVIAVNSAFCKISGQSSEQLEGQKCYTVFHGLYCHTANCPLERLKNGEPLVESSEFRFKKDGKRVRCVYRATPLLNANNQLIGIVEDFKDVSERHAVEETLKQTEKQFEVFMDSLPLGVFIEDGITHDVLYQNTYLASVTGGKSVKSFLPAESPESLSKSYLETEDEHQILDSKGNWRYFLTHKFKFLGVNNQLKIGGVMIDITKKKEAEHYRDVLSKALENSPVSVAILSADLEVEFINPSFANLTGYSIDQIYSKEIFNLNLEHGLGNNLLKVVESIKRGQIWQGEIHLKNRDEDRFWVSALFTPIVDSEGRVQHAVAILDNITKRKEYEKELLLAKSRAEESDRLKSAFLSNLSHEIRTPLNAIIGFSTLLSDNDLSFGERRNISEIIYRNSNDLLRLIENLIEISEIETGQLLIKKKEFSVNSMMSNLYRQLIEEDKKASNVKLSLKKEIHGDDLIILSDQTRINQVLFQLLSNASKFTEKGFIEFGYSLKDESTLMFYVIDSGIGIEPETQAMLFNPFRQADDSNTRRYSGMGLGLAISKHIIEKLGGKIWLNSVPNSGTSVYFTIPFIPINSKFETDSQLLSKVSFKWNNKTILVADDIDANFVYLKAALKKTEANILWARNGMEAVDFVKNGPKINLILMDLVMPEMDGFEATRMIKGLNSGIPIIGQTAYPSQKNYSIAKESGFDSMLEKPIKVNRMLMELDRYLNN